MNAGTTPKSVAKFMFNYCECDERAFPHAIRIRPNEYCSRRAMADEPAPRCTGTAARVDLWHLR